MSASVFDTALKSLVPADLHLVKAMIVRITAVDKTNGLCTIDANDGGGTIAEVPYFVSDPTVNDRCLALTFDTMIAVIGNTPYDTGYNGLDSYNPAVGAASGWAINSSYINYGREAAILYVNCKRTGAAIAGTSRGNITNTQIAGIIGGYPRPSTTVAWSTSSGDLQCAGYVGSDRTIWVTHSPPSIGINTNDNLIFTASYTYARD